MNWHAYYTACRASDHNPFHGAISFDNIGLAWVAIFQVGFLRACDASVRGPIYTQYLTTILRLSYDNAKVTIDLRRTSNLQDISRRTQGFSCVRFTCKVVRSSERVFVN